MSKQDKKIIILIIIVWIIYFSGLFIALGNKKAVDIDYIQNIEERKDLISEIRSLHLYLLRGNSEEDEYMCKAHNQRVLGRTIDPKTCLLKDS